MIEWRPAPDSHYFEFLAERAAWVTYDGKGQTLIRWRVSADGENACTCRGFDVGGSSA